MAPATQIQVISSCWPASSISGTVIFFHSPSRPSRICWARSRSVSTSGHRQWFFSTRKPWDHPPEAYITTRQGLSLEDTRRDLPYLKAPSGRRRRGVGLLPCPIDRPPVADDFAPVGVHLHRDDGNVKALA